MTNKNDARILELKKQIELKKESINKTEKFNPITNCSIEVDGERYNIRAMEKMFLMGLLFKLQGYLDAAKYYRLEDEYLLSGYSLGDWIEDIHKRIATINIIEESKKLKDMENKLSKMLSDSKKVELEIDEIEEFLK